MSLFSWLKRRRLDDDDFDEEIRAHLAMAADERMADGADPKSAHYAALKEFGNVALTTEDARRVWTPGWLYALHDLASDVRIAVRSLAKSPAFSLTVIGVLTLGIGLNAAVFTMLKGIALALLFYDFTAFMLFIFGLAGLALAALGTYGLVSYTVEQGTREIGIRMALGATGPAVVRRFLARGLKLGATGAALGIVIALCLSRLLGTVLFGVSATDPISLARALAVVLACVLLASIVPAWRAAQTSPLVALRHQ